MLATYQSFAVDILYVGATNTANLGDVEVINHLESRYGIGSVTYVEDGSSVSSDGDGRDLIFISESVSSGQVTNKFQNATAGIVTMEVFVVDDLGLSSNDFTGNIVHDDADFTFSGNGPVQALAGLTGTSAIWNSAPVRGAGVNTTATLAAGAVIEADFSAGGTTYYSLLSFEAGSLDINSNNIAGRRVFLSPDATTFSSGGTSTSISGYTVDGLALLDASADWALATIPEPSTYALLVVLPVLLGLGIKRRVSKPSKG